MNPFTNRDAALQKPSDRSSTRASSQKTAHKKGRCGRLCWGFASRERDHSMIGRRHAANCQDMQRRITKIYGIGREWSATSSSDAMSIRRTMSQNFWSLIFTFLNKRLPTHNPTIVYGFTRFLAIRKRVGDEYLGQFANDADRSLFLVRDARWCVALQREVLRTRSHPSLFRGIRAELDGGTLCCLRARGNRRPPRFCVAWIPLNNLDVS